MAQIEQLTLELKQEEDAFVIKEQKLIQELSKFEVSFILDLRTIFLWLCEGEGIFHAIQVVKVKVAQSSLIAAPWTIQSMEFSRPEYWSGQPFPSPGDLPNYSIKCRVNLLV